MFWLEKIETFVKKVLKSLTKFGSLIWFLYLLFTIFQSLWDLKSVKKIEWIQSKNVGSIYKGYKATIISKAYESENVIIKRDYAYLGQGLNVFLSEVDDNQQFADISFFVRECDFHPLKDEISNIPFFAMRKVNNPANYFFVLIDLWKFNYSTSFGLIIMFGPFLLTFFFFKKKVH